MFLVSFCVWLYKNLLYAEREHYFVFESGEENYYLFHAACRQGVAELEVLVNFFIMMSKYEISISVEFGFLQSQVLYINGFFLLQSVGI